MPNARLAPRLPGPPPRRPPLPATLYPNPANGELRLTPVGPATKAAGTAAGFEVTTYAHATLKVRFEQSKQKKAKLAPAKA